MQPKITNGVSSRLKTKENKVLNKMNDNIRPKPCPFSFKKLEEKQKVLNYDILML